MNSQTDITLKLSADKLAELFRLGVLCAADIGCVDTQGRDLIQRLCLQTCVHRARGDCSQCQHQTCFNPATWPTSVVITPPLSQRAH
ncbi:MAG: hypothetical protein RBS36_02495 [Thiomicrospira sp.]|jgi:hypothetical protein|nr:hypothetical protein [Thiomicrospira sp.]